MSALPIQVGTMAIATRASGVCDVGEVGMCSEGSTRGGRPGDSFLGEQGCYDGCSPEDVALFLTVPACVVMQVAGDQCTTITRLMRDFRLDRFAATVPPR